MPDSSNTLSRHIDALLLQDPPRAKSLCVTLLGDAIGPHGGHIWLSDLIALVDSLGVNERLLRTSVFRLVAQNWLHSERHGRRSLYSLSPMGDAQTQAASERIYSGTPADWDGKWTLVVLPRFGHGSLDGRSALRRELIWAGFGAVAPGIFALPRNQTQRAQKVLAKFDAADKALVLDAQELNDNGGLQISDLIEQCWDLQGVALQYQSFIKTFTPIVQAIDSQIRPRQAFAVRTLTIHTWRRIVLHDPQLPRQMLHPQWPGHAARQLCGQLYWKVFDLAESHLDDTIGQDAARYSPLPPYVYARFGGAPDKAQCEARIGG